MMLQDLVERQGIPVFESVPIALNCTAKVSHDDEDFRSRMPYVSITV